MSITDCWNQDLLVNEAQVAYYLFENWQNLKHIKQTHEHHWFTDVCSFYKLQSSQNYLSFSSNDPAYSCLQMDCLSVMIVNTRKLFQLLMEICLTVLIFLTYKQYSYFSLERQYKYLNQTNNQTNEEMPIGHQYFPWHPQWCSFMPQFSILTPKPVKLSFYSLTKGAMTPVQKAQGKTLEQ